MLGVQVKGKFAGEIERYLSTLTHNPKCETLNPKPQTYTPKPKPQNPNPKP